MSIYKDTGSSSTTAPKIDVTCDGKDIKVEFNDKKFGTYNNTVAGRVTMAREISEYFTDLAFNTIAELGEE